MPPRRGKRTKALARHRELLEIERALWAHGLVVAGLDEAGAGPLAGPVFAACVVLCPERVTSLVGVDDSKVLSEERRAELADAIRSQASAWSVAEASVEEIDRLNIRRAAMLAMERALETVRGQVSSLHHVLVDARTLQRCPVPQSEIIRGDARSLSIAAASILAKVARDAVMVALGAEYPGYGFERHKGYATSEHIDAIRRIGVTPVHRSSFAPVKELVSRSPDLFGAVAP